MPKNVGLILFLLIITCLLIVGSVVYYGHRELMSGIAVGF